MKVIKKIANYFVQSWQELTKVVWPSRKQAIEMTLAVIIITLTVGALLGIFDFGFSELLTALINLKG